MKNLLKMFDCMVFWFLGFWINDSDTVFLYHFYSMNQFKKSAQCDREATNLEKSAAKIMMDVYHF